jgi:hypothetical protein
MIMPTYTEDNVQNAVLDVQAGISQRQAAKTGEYPVRPSNDALRALNLRNTRILIDRGFPKCKKNI